MEFDLEEAKEFFETGSQYYQEGSFQESLEYYRMAMSSFRLNGDDKMEADTLLEIGNVYSHMGRFFQATQNYKKSLKIYSRLDDLIGEGYALTGLGMIQEKNKNFDEARKYYGQGLQKFKEAKDYDREEIVLTLMAGTYDAQEGLDELLGDYMEEYEEIPEIDPNVDSIYTEKISTMVHDKRVELEVSSKYIITLIIYLLALITAELMTTYVNKEWGLIIHTIILFALLVNAAMVESKNFTNLLISLMPVPIIRIVGLTIPMLQIKPLYWFPIVAIPLFAASLYSMRVQKLTLRDVGMIIGNIPIQLLIAATGFITGIIEFMILKPAPLIPEFTITYLIGAGLILLMATGLAEELLFRGILQTNTMKAFGTAFGLIYTSLVFSTMHIGWIYFSDLLFVFCVAMFYGYCFIKTKSITGITLAHGISNSLLFLVMPFVNLAAFGISI